MSWRTSLEDFSDSLALAVGRILFPGRARAFAFKKKQLNAMRDLLAIAKAEGVVDPFVASARARVDPALGLLAFEKLSDVGAVSRVFAVRDDGGEVLGTFSRREDIPARVENVYLEELEIGPENISLAFEFAG